MCDRLEELLPAPAPAGDAPDPPMPDYAALVLDHNRRKKHLRAVAKVAVVW